ncbi:MAG: phytanoyl-CoA dioxygenase family protein [Pseudomonadota bacterium]
MTAAEALLPADKPLLVSSAAESCEALRARFQTWGYLYFPGQADGDRCDSLLEEIVARLDPEVVLGADGPQLAGRPITETDEVWDRCYPEIQALEAFHRFFHEEDLLELMRVIGGDMPFVYPMKMARVATPRRLGHETPPHQDAHSHNAPERMAGIWVALHDAGKGMGRLKILPKSHLGGVRPVFEAQGVGGVQCEVYPQELTWHVSDVRRGDVILFHCCTVHRAEPNTSSDRVRISVDTRFTEFGTPVFSTNLEPHHGWRIDRLDWDYVYRDWLRDDLKYYWRDYPALF